MIKKTDELLTHATSDKRDLDRKHDACVSDPVIECAQSASQLNRPRYFDVEFEMNNAASDTEYSVAGLTSSTRCLPYSTSDLGLGKKR